MWTITGILCCTSGKNKNESGKKDSKVSDNHGLKVNIAKKNVNYINNPAFIKKPSFQCHKSGLNPHLLTYLGNEIK